MAGGRYEKKWRQVKEVAAGGHQVASLVSLSSFNGLQPKVISYRDALKSPNKNIHANLNFCGRSYKLRLLQLSSN